ncbi:MAG: hypothetical protein Q8876_04245 [Bacillota bacterium]|nr:hypothetical protein [Bacillota bacterium]
MHKKISVGITIAIAALATAIAFSVAYITAMSNFNESLQDLNRQKTMYARISEIDSVVRQEYKGKIDEDALNESICKGYILGLNNESIQFIPKDQVYQYTNINNANINVVTLSDGSAVVIYKNGVKPIITATKSATQAQTQAATKNSSAKKTSSQSKND